MADRYLIETSAVDGYLLEDGSGVLLLEAPYIPPRPVRPLQFRSSFSYQITRAVAASAAVAPRAPSTVRALQNRTGWHYQTIRSVSAVGVVPPAFVPANPPRPLQSRAGWQLYIQNRLASVTVVTVVPDLLGIPLEEPIGEFWDLPPYPRQQPRTYVVPLLAFPGAQLQANLYRTPSAAISLATGIPLAAAAKDIRSFTPGALVSTINLAAQMLSWSHLPRLSSSLDLTTGIALAAQLGDQRLLTVPGFQPQFTAALYCQTHRTADLNTGIPLSAALTMTTNVAAALGSGITFIAVPATAYGSAGNVQLGTAPSFAANLYVGSHLPRLALSLDLTTGIPLAAGLMANASGSVALATNIPLLAALAGLSQTTTSLATGIALASVVGNLASVSVLLLSSLPAQMVAALVAGATATPNLAGAINLGTVSMRDLRHMTATLTAAIPFGTSAGDLTSVIAVLTTAINLGTVPGADASRIVAALTNAPRFAANPAAQAQLQATLTTLIRFAASSQASASLIASALSAAVGPTQTGTASIVYAPALVSTVYAPALIVYGIPID